MSRVNTVNTVTPLKMAIVASGMRAYQVADEIGRSEPEMSRWASGRRIPPPEIQVALSKVLGETVEHLFPGQAAA